MKALGTADQAPPGLLTHVPLPRSAPDPQAPLLAPELPELPRPPKTAPPPEAAPARRRPWPAKANPGLLTALMFGVFIPVLLAALSGNLTIPHNDAWSYSRIAQEFGRTGHLRLLGWNRSALLGQIVVLGPLARFLLAQQLFVALTAAAVLVAAYALLRPRLGARRAGWASAVLALWPGFGLMGTSFMADMPALAAMLLCLVLGRRAARTESLWLFAASMAVGFWATTIRQQAVAAPVAVGLCLLADRRFRTRPRLAALLGGGAVFSAAFLLFYAWHDGLPKSDPPQYQLAADWPSQLHVLLVQSWFTLAVALAPAVFQAARPRQWSKAARWATLAAAVVAIQSRHKFGPQNLFLQNYLSMRGAYYGVDWDTGRHRVVFSPGIWSLVTILACVSGALLVGLAVENRRSGGCDRFLGTFAVITAAGTAVTNVVGQDVYDRYLLVLAPAVLAVVLAPRRTIPVPAPSRSPETLTAHVPLSPRAALLGRPTARRRPAIRPAALAAGLLVGLLSLGTLTVSLAWDTARWQIAEKVTRESGLPPEKVDAGLEWIGWHSADGVTDRNPAPPVWGWEDYLGTTPACRILTVSPDRDHPFALLGVYDFKTYMVFGSSHLYYYDTRQPGCPTAIPQS